MFSRARLPADVQRSMNTVFVPIKLRGGQNAREHWAVRAKRVKKERDMACLLCPRHSLPVVVTLTRCGSRELDDDNLEGVFKAVRDGICDRLGVDDGATDKVRFEYRQEKCKRADEGFRIQLETM